LHPIKNKYPNSQVTWVTNQKAAGILKGNDFIDRIMFMSFETALQLDIEEFDIVYNFDKAHEACALMSKIRSKEKKGFTLGKDGMIIPLCEAARYFMDIGLSDKLKRLSQKTQQQIVFEIANFNYNHEKSIYVIDEESKILANELLKKNGVGEKDFIVSFNTGCSNRLFVDRKWTIEGYAELAALLYNLLGAKIVLLGGPGEIERNQEIAKISTVPIINSGNDNTIELFAALIKRSNLVVSGDTLGGHLAAALNVPVVLIFGNVIASEIELYGNGKKVQTNMSCFACYKHKCEFKKTCMNRITAVQVFNAAKELLNEKGLLKIDL